MPARHNATIDGLLANARRRLAHVDFSIERREASLLLGHCLGLSEAQLLARGELAVDEVAAERFERLLRRRLGGEPVAYLFGEREFFGRSFAVDRRVLIPRPETEHLVELCLERAPAQTRVVDVGTGSGCVALSLALERKDLAVSATDRSAGALAVAAINRRRHGLSGRVGLANMLWLSAARLGSIDMVVSNPPYIGPEDRGQLSAEILDFEPHLALFPEGDELGSYRVLLEQCRALRPGALVVLELGAGQLPYVVALAEGFRIEEVRHDYGKVARVLCLRREKNAKPAPHSALSAP